MMMGARAVACNAVSQGFDAGVAEKVAAQKEGLALVVLGAKILERLGTTSGNAIVTATPSF
jgi:hypothetical protein